MGPFLGRATAMVKAMAEQAQPFDGAGGGRPRWPGGIATHPDAGRDRVPATWSARGLDRAIDTVRATPNRIGALLSRGAHAGDVATKTLVASRDAALESAEEVTRREGASGVANAIRNARTVNGSLVDEELPISDYTELNVSGAVAAVKELTAPAEIRIIVAHEEVNKNRHGVVSAAQTRLAAIAQEVVGIN